MASPAASSITYRPMSAADLQTVMQVEKRAYAFPWSEGIFRDCISAGYDCRLLCLDNVIAGHAVLSVGAGEAHLLNVCVQREQQGRGLGREFVRHIIERAQGFGAHAIYLEVRPSNKKAIRLYDSLGFNQIGLRKDYYPGDPNKEDALVLALNLQTTDQSLPVD